MRRAVTRASVGDVGKHGVCCLPRHSTEGPALMFCSLCLESPNHFFFFSGTFILLWALILSVGSYRKWEWCDWEGTEKSVPMQRSFPLALCHCSRPQSESSPPYCIYLLCRVPPKHLPRDAVNMYWVSRSHTCHLYFICLGILFSWCLFVVCLETGSRYVVQSSLELRRDPFALPPKPWDGRCVLPHLTLFCWYCLHWRLCVAKACPRLTVVLRMALNHDLSASVTIITYLNAIMIFDIYKSSYLFRWGINR